MKKLVEGKIALVTGGGAGMGACDCWKFAEEGAKGILIVDLNVDDAEKVAKEIMAQYPECKCVAVKCNVAKEADVDHCFEVLDQEFGTLDILVNNAGITRDNLLMKMSEEDFDAVISTNLKGVFNCIKHISRQMLKQKAGRIINISSVSGVLGNAGQANYCAAKAGVIGITKSAARELASRGITVNAVAPGFIATEMTDVLSDSVKAAATEQIPMKHFGSTQDIAETVAFLASDKAGYITGQVLSVDGGMAM